MEVITLIILMKMIMDIIYSVVMVIHLKNFLRFYLVITITMIFQKISMFLIELRKPCMEIISTCLIILTIFHN